MHFEEILTGTGKKVRVQVHGSRGKITEVPIPLIQEVCFDIKKDQIGDVLIHTYDFETPIGENHCIKINPKDIVIEVREKGERKPVLWVKERNPEETTRATVVLIYTDRGDYVLIDSCFGEYRPPYPWKIQDPNKKKISEEFWSTHAWTE